MCRAVGQDDAGTGALQERWLHGETAAVHAGSAAVGRHGRWPFFNRTVEFGIPPRPISPGVLRTKSTAPRRAHAVGPVLEAMGRAGAVTVDGQKTYTLKAPFIVLATQNPIDHEETCSAPRGPARFAF